MRALIIVALLLTGGRARAGEMVGVLLDEGGGFYTATGEALKKAIPTKHPGTRVVVSTPGPTKMARCNSARRFIKVGAQFIIAVGRDVAMVTMAECDHDMVYAVYDTAPFTEDQDEATGGVWVASPLKLLMLLKSLRPFKSLAVVFDSGSPSSKREIEMVTAAAKKLGVTVVSVDAAGGGDLSGVEGAQAVYYAAIGGGDADLLERLSVTAMQAKAPVVTSFVGGEAHGALLAQYADPIAVAGAVAALAAELLDGEDAEDVPEVRGKVVVAINAGVAKALRLEVTKAAAAAITRTAK